MRALGIVFLLECCLFVAYLALRTAATRFHARVLLAAMLGILVIAIDYERLSFPFVFWAALTICWTAGVILTASEMLGGIMGGVKNITFKGRASREPISEQAATGVPPHQQPLAR